MHLQAIFVCCTNAPVLRHWCKLPSFYENWATNSKGLQHQLLVVLTNVHLHMPRVAWVRCTTSTHALGLKNCTRLTTPCCLSVNMSSFPRTRWWFGSAGTQEHNSYIMVACLRSVHACNDGNGWWDVERHKSVDNYVSQCCYACTVLMWKIT